MSIAFHLGHTMKAQSDLISYHKMTIVREWARSTVSNFCPETIIVWKMRRKIKGDLDFKIAGRKSFEIYWKHFVWQKSNAKKVIIDNAKMVHPDKTNQYVYTEILVCIPILQIITVHRTLANNSRSQLSVKHF